MSAWGKRQARVDTKPSTEPITTNGATNSTTSSATNSTTSGPKPSAGPKKPAWGAPPQAPTAAAETIAATPPERSSSAYPTLHEAMENLSLNSAVAQPVVRSRSAQPTARRSYLHSAVPESAVLTPIRRPDQGGKAGKVVDVYTNHFRIQVDDAIINQYDIEIFMIGRDKKPRLARKDERWETVQRIAKREKNFPIIWYDEGKTIYTRELLTDFTKPLQITFNLNNEEKTFQFQVLNLVRQEKIRDIFDFIEKKTAIRPRDSIRIIETLFKQRARNDLIAIRNQFYDRKQKLDDLGDGRGMANGFYQALFLTQGGPTLNINLAFTCFYMPLNFVEFATKYLRKDITKGLSEIELQGFKRIVRNMLIETLHTGRDIRYRIRGFGLPANQIMFVRGASDDAGDASLGEKISVADFFAEKYQKLKYPHLPCIDGMSGTQKRANWLPMEFVKLVAWERSLKPLDSVQRALVTKKSVIKPDQRYNQIMNVVQNRQFDSDPYLKELNIKVETKEMLQLKARILPPPEVKYRGQGNSDVTERVNFGKWTIRNRFYTTRDISKWGMVYFGSKPTENVIQTLKDFETQLPPLLQRYGILIKSKPITIAKPPTKEEIEKTLVNASKEHWQLTVVVLNNTLDNVYDYVKQCGNQRYGLVTQCVSYQSLEKNIGKLDMYVQNLSQKINAKMGCINGIVNLKAALSRPSNEDLFMFFGADVTHTTCSAERPSIAAVVGSRDPTNSLYAARLCEQYPKLGRCSMEIIKDLDAMIIDLLQVFARSCANRLPNKIVFYRDGVDDGQYQKVLDNEVAKIKQAFRTIYVNRAQPKLTFIIVKKRHNTRFFVYDGQMTKNVEAGTVVDHQITHPSQFDFYLCSQAALMGTSRPALYHVLHDEIGFTSDEIQQLTYWLCHTDARCSKAVSVPAPIHYAHLAAYASRTFDFDDNLDQGSDNGGFVENIENVSMDDIKTKLMVLDSKIANDMWFV
ncbi:unnamed protein product [Adineta steineri]|uniref:Uncharacterized protein n=1 Tax=Adineta steineri TaxID=433720 RepID=A0A814F0E3_9BILA|nr:unnamed protein product [Adineta steineri]CAF1377380.1 unnamed protein product [Adineta steineri]